MFLRYFKVKRKIVSCNTKKLTAVYASKLAKTYQDNQTISCKRYNRFSTKYCKTKNNI